MPANEIHIAVRRGQAPKAAELANAECGWWLFNDSDYGPLPTLHP